MIRSEMILPLGSHGVLNIGSKELNAFDEVDISTAELLASTATAVLDQVTHEQQLREKQRELETQNERLDEFASIVSHDLRNPLTIAQGNLELAKDQCECQSLAEIEAAHQRMEALITDLLHLARAGQTIDDMTPVELSKIAVDAWRMIESEEATFKWPSESLTVTADKSRLRQLFENLFRNAIDHGGSDVTIRLGTIPEQSGFYIEDDGPGIPPEDRERVFEAGYTTREDGTGLGLLTVRRIAEAHGWSVSGTTGEEGGARFEIRI